MVNFHRTFVGELMDNPRFKVVLYVTGMVCLGTFGVVLDYLRVPIGYIVLVISALVLPLGYGMYILGKQMGIINNNKDLKENSSIQPIIKTLKEGFEARNLDLIKKSVFDVQRLFTVSLLEDKASETLDALGRELSRFVLKYLSPFDQAETQDKYYIAQLSTIASLCGHIARAQPCIEEIQAATSTSYGPRIFEILHHRGAMTAGELVSKIGMPHRSQLSDIIAKLIDAGLVRQERYGENVWYSLTGRGTLLAIRYFQFQPKWAENVRFLLAEILRRSKDAEGTHPNELMENLKHQLTLSDETARQVVTDVLDVLSDNKVVTKTSDGRYVFR